LSKGGLQPTEIGVVTPYRKQVEKILQRLAEYESLNDVKIRSTEDFQGSERKAIIISTVRTPKIGRPRLSFFNCPKHVNVSISRAQQLLVIVRNRDMLLKQEHWQP